MERRRTVHEVVVLALDGVVAADLALPAEVFGRTRLADGWCPYRVRVASIGANVDAGIFTLRTPWRLAALADADTIIVPGQEDPTRLVAASAVQALRDAAGRGTRIASICVGAFVLAQAGFLSGLRATTHWAGADLLAQLHPDIDIDPNVLFVDNGQILTSAGAAAGLDLCLHLVRRDHGSAVAAATARMTVMPLERAGGQAQFIDHEPARAEGTSLEPFLRWLEANHTRHLTLADMAAQAAIGARSLSRHFRDQVGTTPVVWLRAVRIRHAQRRLETTDETVDTVAHQVGYRSTTTFREHFTESVGASPRAYRRSFGDRG